MSHWKDFSKLSVYTYLSHKPSHAFISRGKTYNVPMIPYVGFIHAGYNVKIRSTVAQLFFEVRTLEFPPYFYEFSIISRYIVLPK
jgi:hypothetical protein